MDCGEAQLLCSINIGRGVVNQEAFGSRESDFVQQQVEDSRIRFDKLDVAGKNDVIEQIEEGILVSRTWKCLG